VFPSKMVKINFPRETQLHRTYPERTWISVPTYLDRTLPISSLSFATGPANFGETDHPRARMRAA